MSTSVIRKGAQIYSVKVSINSTFPCKKKLKFLVLLSIGNSKQISFNLQPSLGNIPYLSAPV